MSVGRLGSQTLGWLAKPRLILLGLMAHVDVSGHLSVYDFPGALMSYGVGKWMADWAPEMLMKDSKGHRIRYNQCVDWFSFGT